VDLATAQEIVGLITGLGELPGSPQGACDQPYIASFMYVFDGKYLQFLSTRYGRKIQYFLKKAIPESLWR